MTDSFHSPEKEILRIALDKAATQDFASMASRLKAENPHVKIQPSAFVSFLVSDFYATYFEKDLSILIAEFFDSKSFYESQLLQAKAQADFEAVMSAALSSIKRIKAKTRRGAGVSRRKSKSVSPPST